MIKSNKASTTYLFRHYYNPESLEQYAKDQFFRAIRKGRLVAFVGSMATEKHGYPDWPELLKLGITASLRVINNVHGLDKRTVSEFEKISERLRLEVEHNPKFDARVITSVLGGLVDLATGDSNGGARVNFELAKLLTARKNLPTYRKDANVVANLVHRLNIHRIVTTNYDMEFEYEMAGIAGLSINDRVKAFEKFAEEQLGHEYVEHSSRPTHLSLTLEDGNSLVSDAFERERLDRLIEFAVGSSAIDYHIMHLHGRIDKPESMVVSYRDYDRLYRLSGDSKLPFEQALSLLYAANPVLFVGLGMNETELNTALQELVGNQPYRQAGQTFLLWNKPSGYNASSKAAALSAEEVKANIRLDMLHRLGVLTIFDDELTEHGGEVKTSAVSGDHNSKAVFRLAKTVENVGKKFREYRSAEIDSVQPSQWRGIDFSRNPGRDPAVYTWLFERRLDDPKLGGGFLPKDFANHSLRAITARPGTGKSGRAIDTLKKWCYDKKNNIIPNRRALLINTSLRLDTDAVLELIKKFLVANTPADGAKISREKLFERQDCFFHETEEKIIIFKGLERLFNKAGKPLSAEVDRFFRAYLKAAIDREKPKSSPKKTRRRAVNNRHFCRIAVYGSRRMRLYLRSLLEQVQRELGPEVECDKIIFLDEDRNDPSGYLSMLKRQFGLTGLDLVANRPTRSGDRDYARQLFAALFQSKKFNDAFAGEMEKRLAFAVMIVMAFVGQPVEPEVMFHAPRITELLQLKSGNAAKRNALKDILNKLKDLRLIERVSRPYWGPNPASTDADYRERFALHLSLQGELRERHGVPLSEAILSTSFNMSLYSAQPSDAALPDPSVHDELGRLIDWLIAAQKDDTVFNESDRRMALSGAPAFHISACLRAALAVVRGFYSTSSLLSLDRGDRLISNHRDGALSEHADRIGRLIRRINEVMAERKIYSDKYGEKISKEKMGPNPIYADEMVWLHNEHGVVKLAQGDLYEARVSFREAERVNSKYVEYSDRSHNWRRIWLNQLVVDIERGKLAEAEDRISRIENSINRDGDFSDAEQIIVKLGKHEMPTSPMLKLELARSDEDCLAIALCTGYRGLVLHLRGEFSLAERYFLYAITMLEKLDEQRACALFRKHYASLLAGLQKVDDERMMLKIALAGAESVQQMDIVYSARLARNRYNLRSESASDRRLAMRIFNDALEYAEQSDVHRVGIEVRRSLALLKLANGDFESALDHATSGMAMAGRFGMSLQKLSLRILLGQILIARNNEEAGRQLIESAITLGDRIGYQRAVENAQSALIAAGTR